jgi:hypothetical protein
VDKWGKLAKNSRIFRRGTGAARVYYYRTVDGESGSAVDGLHGLTGFDLVPQPPARQSSGSALNCAPARLFLAAGASLF